MNLKIRRIIKNNAGTVIRRLPSIWHINGLKKLTEPYFPAHLAYNSRLSHF